MAGALYTTVNRTYKVNICHSSEITNTCTYISISYDKSTFKGVSRLFRTLKNLAVLANICMYTLSHLIIECFL